MTTLNPGLYTAIVSGVGDLTGVALIEVYEIPDEADESRMINISTRSVVKTGGDVQIAGFVIHGPNPKTILIRASGPSLAKFGVSGVLLDPKVELRDSTSLIKSNDNWGDDLGVATAIESTRTALNAFSWPDGSKDAAILITLAPGLYTALVSGVGNTSGIALVEIYEVD